MLKVINLHKSDVWYIKTANKQKCKRGQRMRCTNIA